MTADLGLGYWRFDGDAPCPIPDTVSRTPYSPRNNGLVGLPKLDHLNS